MLLTAGTLGKALRSNGTWNSNASILRSVCIYTCKQMFQKENVSQTIQSLSLLYLPVVVEQPLIHVTSSLNENVCIGGLRHQHSATSIISFRDDKSQFKRLCLLGSRVPGCVRE